MRAYRLFEPYFFCLHFAQVGGRRAASGCVYRTASDGKRCETEEVSRHSLSFLAIDGYARVRAS